MPFFKYPEYETLVSHHLWVFFLLFKLQFLMNFIRSLPSLADAAPIRGTHVKELGPKSSTKGRILHRLLARSLLTPIPAVAHVSVSITAFSS